jgi:hypothetical protein
LPKSRKPIPRAIRDQVLAEFRHRCATCGRDGPHVHHIDEDPANNDPLNLLPLCPSCHVIDQHNPTAQVDPRKLRLFRRYKDPVILGPQFHPLFLRLAYLLAIDPGADASTLRDAGKELVAFVNALSMGGFYHPRISDLVIHHQARVSAIDVPDRVARERKERDDREYREHLERNRDKAIELAVEMLRYQGWAEPAKQPGRSVAK